MSEFKQLKEFEETDVEKHELLSVLKPRPVFYSKGEISTLDSIELNKLEFSELDFCDECLMMREPEDEQFKYCPKCGAKFFENENFCPDCLVSLKKNSDDVDVKYIDSKVVLSYQGKNDFENILSDECIQLINDFNFTIADFNQIIHSIKSQTFKNLDKLITDFSIDLDDLDILDKVILFAKSFVNVEYKSYGSQLGYYEFNKIYVDDRQTKSLQITTIIHELTHFLIKEILTGIVCKILDCNKNPHVEAVITYILSYFVENQLIDEYAAHTVEGRFTIFGYQDYSSFVAIQKRLDDEDTVEIAKTIGNTLSIYVKDILEGFLDWDLRDEIKQQFLEDTIEKPDYGQLQFESCKKLTDDGFMKAIWLILSDGFANANADVIKDFLKEFEN